MTANVFRVLTNYHAWLAGGKLMLGSGIAFAMPVRTDGRGEVNIDQFCSLGFKPAPRFGSGEILIQAREPEAVIVIGKSCSFSNNISIIARKRIELGDHCVIGDRVTILDSDFHVIDPLDRLEKGGPGETEPVRIGKNCWIGTDAMILKGVTIGDDCIIAPKSVVTKSFPARSVLGGAPAQLVKSFDS